MKKVLLILFFSVVSLFAFEELTERNYKDKISGKNVLLDFHSPYWGACKVLGKNLTKYNASQNDGVVIYKVDAYEKQTIAKEFNVVAVPTLIYLKNGKVVAKKIGISSVKEIKSNVKKHFK